MFLRLALEEALQVERRSHRAQQVVQAIVPQIRQGQAHQQIPQVVQVIP